MKHISNFGLLFAALATTLMLSGCAGEKETPTKKAETTKTAAADDHSGWWCAEHGVPEEECSMCSASAAKDFKAKDDWCEEHNRAESQCFICNPGNADKFSKLYEAKFGKKPPATTD